MYRIGIDVGGTGIKIGVVNENSEIIQTKSIPTRIDIPFSEQISEISDCIISLLSEISLTVDDINTIGVGIPGIADSATGEIIKCTNMGWNHVPFRDALYKHIQKPIYIDNDANVAALAESVAGVSAGTSSSVFITIGTGIGSGIILNGHIWKGFHGIGGELGHVIMRIDGVPCTCGNNGCLERYCSATALIRMAREDIDLHPESIISTMTNHHPENINAQIVINAAKAGDPYACSIYEQYTEYISQAVAGVVNLLDPEVIVLGGGVSKAGDFLLEPIRQRFPAHVLFNDQPLPSVELAVLGADAGIIGAAMLS